MSNFIIISLPRSRTAWLSVALTYGDSYCFHEPLLGCDSVSDLKVKFDSVEAKVVGGADTGAVLFLDNIIKEIPDIRVLVVERDAKECEISMEDMGFDHVDLTVPKNALKEAGERENVKVVRYDDLSDPGTGQEIWEYCTGQNDFSAQRWLELAKLNIQVDNEMFFKELDYQQHSIGLLEEEITWRG